ncbi:hypothetical protein SADUNF_Sadunf07G0044700 [Salix dunnii]|uniref:Uncharacterized protein n=1 Tax=Salix dunnii TaxID=1413687 RepID=A0A835N285_9ROSI|nr:hypothetical protein SADUNF_Sadunf07G0044700 [Salix dunnii]
MVAVFGNEFVGWFFITLKLREAVGSAVAGAPMLEFPENHEEEETRSPDFEWVISIQKKIEQAGQEDEAGSWSKLSIYRVPHYLREMDGKSYVPQIVSLGPYHHGKEPLRQMDQHKWRCLHHVMKRTNQDIKLYLDAVTEIEGKARSCYEGPINLSSNEFVEMMVLDGCFMLELFRGVAEGFRKLGYPRNDPAFAIRGSMHSMQRDMIMLENQLPLFVLDRLLGLQLTNSDQKGLLAQLALKFFDPLTPTPLTKSDRTRLKIFPGSAAIFDPLSVQGGLHCLDVFRKSLLHPRPKPVPKNLINSVADKRPHQLIHCVTELREAGIKLRKRKTDRFWDVKFKKGILRVPRLLIHDGTKSLFLNLIALQQCHIDCGNEITSFVIFMDNLINSPEDVAYLHYCGIIEHWLGSDADVAHLFNQLCQEVVFDINDSYLSRLSEEVNHYYKQKWNTWRASLKHNYFNNPWAILSFFAAVVLLLLTFTQTFFGVYAYYRPRS